MKITAILGSPHGQRGTTARMMNALLESAQAAGAQTETILLGNLDIAPCRGCDVCHKTGKCAIDDDFHAVLQSMLESDAIVLASPNYIFSVSAQMKALFDRCCGPVHLMSLQGKYGAAVVTSGGGGCDEVEAYILRFMGMAGCWTVGSVGAEARELFDPEQLPAALGRAAELGAKLVTAVEAGAGVPGQEDALAGGRAFMRQLVAQMQDHWAYEHAVWQSRGV
jgi:multimeric flavodoxin WrbA